VKEGLDRKAIKNIESAHLLVDGRGCINCATWVRNILLGLEGVLVAYLRPEQWFVSAAYALEMVTVQDLIQAVAHAANNESNIGKPRPFQIKEGQIGCASRAFSSTPRMM
jgi:hypothetical protein